MRTLIAAFLFTVLGAAEAIGCTNPPGWRIEDAIEHADAIFMGEVQRIEIRRVWARYEKDRQSVLGGGIVFPEHGLMYRPQTTFTLKVDRMWKGDEGEVVVVSTDFSSCSADLRIARRYLVYAVRGADGQLGVSSLSVRPWSDRLEDLPLLGQPTHDYFGKRAIAIGQELATKQTYPEQDPEPR